jgi:DNA-binding MarR family transcriptional regulator
MEVKERKTPLPTGDTQPEWQLLFDKLAEIEARLPAVPDTPPAAGMSDRKLAVMASSIYQARRRRLQHFDESLFGEPAWDMLLDLFVNRASGRRVNITSLCLAADVAQSTGLRYVALLEQKGLVERMPAGDDRRVILVDLTQEGFKAMRRYVVEGIGRFELPRLD